MTSTTRSITVRSSGRRLVEALSTAAAVALIGVSALSPQDASAAGIATGYRQVGGQPSATSPTALPPEADAADVTYRWTERGWVRA